jgi:hypothetical protein
MLEVETRTAETADDGNTGLDATNSAALVLACCAAAACESKV